jgi:DNA modification methylase/predicted RNA-binding Zn-ribbon protein involved in translation (DUF1610 family)
VTQNKLVEEKDEFVESLQLTTEKIREDLEKMKVLEGFPIGDIEDILELSDPPYYTTYPNPYIKEFIEFYGTHYDDETDDYDVEPFVGDVSEGKDDAVYNVHSYHTKVPPKAIMNYINHYTKKGDIVFDGFCGSGMTGIACQISGRKAILSDISPIASFISYNYNNPVNFEVILEKIDKIFSKVFDEYGWVYETFHTNGEIGTINYTVWSDIYKCPNCGFDFDFWSVGVDIDNKKILKEYLCPHCDFELSNKIIDRLKTEYTDNRNRKLNDVKSLPVMIDYTVNKKKFRKIPDELDLELIKKVEKLEIPYWYPTNEIPEGYNTNQPKESHGIKYMDQFYTKRNLLVLSCIFDQILKEKDPILKFLFFSFLHNHPNRRNRWIIDRNHPKGTTCGPLSNTFYFPNLQSEVNIFNSFKKAINKFKKVKDVWSKNKAMISNQSSTFLKNIPTGSIDYVFVDPPFGQNIMYSEMNLIWESWIKVLTNNKNEAIINSVQNKNIFDYGLLISECFKEFFRVLKPNRWLTVEFHNSRMDVWKSIQKALIQSGFVIAQVAILDKKHGTIYQDRKINSVRNDLVINAYKPSKSFLTTFLKNFGLNMEKKFIKMHLGKLPIEPNIERTREMLYSRLIAQYIQNGFEVRVNVSEFYEMLSDKFEERDGYWFNKDQTEKYEKKSSLKNKLSEEDLNQMILGISDEKSALIWLAQFLQYPKTYDEIFIEFTKNLLTSIDKTPELKTILDENFTTESGKYTLPSDLERIEKEKIRDKRLIKEFNEILEETQKSKKKIKEVRKEALLHGLMKLYKEKDVEKIKLLGARLDRKIIDSDDDISAIIDWAQYK